MMICLICIAKERGGSDWAGNMVPIDLLSDDGDGCAWRCEGLRWRMGWDGRVDSRGRV